MEDIKSKIKDAKDEVASLKMGILDKMRGKDLGPEKKMVASKKKGESIEFDDKEEDDEVEFDVNDVMVQEGARLVMKGIKSDDPDLVAKGIMEIVKQGS